ncbi:MAG: sulfotransferase [Solirubrobacterales bacterium]|nr:sulfotransferase [Solirubrobacterales bacterium]
MSGIWDPRNPAHDNPTPHDPARPATHVVVCSTPRSGSGLLCRGLAATGYGGLPAEYFNPNQRVPLTARWGCAGTPHAYGSALRAMRTRNGAFATKLHWDQLEQLWRELTPGASGEPPFDVPADFLFELVPEARFVYIVRSDVDAQAVSLWTAMHTNEWHRRADVQHLPVTRPRYDFAEIDRLRDALVLCELHWDRFFRANSIRPVEVVYEELVHDYRGEVTRVMRESFGRAIDPASISAPDSVPQSDTVTKEVLEMLASDRANRPTSFTISPR